MAPRSKTATKASRKVPVDSKSPHADGGSKAKLTLAKQRQLETHAAKAASKPKDDSNLLVSKVLRDNFKGFTASDTDAVQVIGGEWGAKL
jgi:hypothetical protein